MGHYSEHEKLAKAVDKSQAIGEFLEWLRYTKHIYLAEDIPGFEHNSLIHYRGSDQDLLAEFFRIDRRKLEEEKVAMLDEIRTIQ